MYELTTDNTFEQYIVFSVMVVLHEITLPQPTLSGCMVDHPVKIITTLFVWTHHILPVCSIMLAQWNELFDVELWFFYLVVQNKK